MTRGTIEITRFGAISAKCSQHIRTNISYIRLAERSNKPRPILVFPHLKLLTRRLTTGLTSSCFDTRRLFYQTINMICSIVSRFISVKKEPSNKSTKPYSRCLCYDLPCAFKVVEFVLVEVNQSSKNLAAAPLLSPLMSVLLLLIEVP